MHSVLIQPNNSLSGRTQSETENSGPERLIRGRKSVLSDPMIAKYRRNWGKSGGWVQNGLTSQTEWWSRGESNPRPLQCECSALPTELLPHTGGDKWPIYLAAVKPLLHFCGWLA